MQIRGRKAENLLCFRDLFFLAPEQFCPQLVRNIMVTDYFFVYSYFFQCEKKIEKIFWDMEIIGNRRKKYDTEFIFLLRIRKFLNLVNTMFCRSLDLVDQRLSLNIKQDCTHIPSVFCDIIVNSLTICKSHYCSTKKHG